MSIISIQDYNNDYSLIFKLLNNLTNAPLIEKNNYLEIINNLSSRQNIYIYIENNIPYGIITLLMEQKLIHGGKFVCHIEDLVVDPSKKKQGIGTKLLNFAKIKAKENNCYKIILDCSEEVRRFYEKSDFIKKEIQMRYNL